MRRITKAEDITTLAAAFQEHEQQLDNIHLSTLFMRLAALLAGQPHDHIHQQPLQQQATLHSPYRSQQRQQQQQQRQQPTRQHPVFGHLLEQLQQRALSAAHGLTTREVANIVWATAKIYPHSLKTSSTSSWRQHDGKTAASSNTSTQQEQRSGRHSQHSMRQGAPAPAILPQLLAALRMRARQLLSQGSFVNPQEMTMLVYGLSMLQPQQLEPHTDAASSSSSMQSSQQTTGTGTGSSIDDITDDNTELLVMLCSASARHLQRFNAQDLSNTLYALAKLQHAPPREWMDAWAARATHQLPWFTPQALANSAWALAKLKQQQPQWLAACMASAAQAAHAREVGAQEACNLLWAAGETQLDVPDPVIGELLRCLRPQLPACSPQDLASIMYALARLQAAPGVGWTEAYFAAAAGKLPAFDANTLSITLWALAELGLAGGPAWKMAVLARLREQLPTATPRQLSTSLRGAAALGWVLPQRWLACFLAECKPRLGRFQPHDVADAAWALATLKAPCDARWGFVWLQPVL